MTPTEFLRNRNIIAKNKSDLMIGFDNGTEESLIGLLETYHKIDTASNQRALLIAYDTWRGLKMSGTDKIYIDTFLEQYISKRKKDTLKVGDIVNFHSGNYEGLTGKITAVDWNSNNPQAIYKIWHTVELNNGATEHIEKSEHWDFL